jgi:hypothetical protein
MNQIGMLAAARAQFTVYCPVLVLAWLLSAFEALSSQFCVRAAFSPCNGVFAGEEWP